MSKFFGPSWKKFTVFLVSTLGVMTKDYFGMTEEQLQALIVLASGYMVSQSLSDFGKSKALIEAKAKKQQDQPV